jgi:hypothetical protein
MDMKAVKLMITAIGIVICSTPMYARAQSACNPPQAGLDSWQIATPENVGLSSSVLCSMVKWLNDSKNVDVLAVVIARHGSSPSSTISPATTSIWGIRSAKSPSTPKRATTSVPSARV